MINVINEVYTNIMNAKIDDEEKYFKPILFYFIFFG